MIIDSAEQISALKVAPAPQGSLTAERFLLIRPDQICGDFCPDNTFTDLDNRIDQAKAVEQHQSVVDLLQALGKEVVVFPGTHSDDTFCNNVFATNHQKELIVGNMYNLARQPEGSRRDVRDWFRQQGYRVREIKNLTNEPAELTGVTIIDHARNIGFIGLGTRCTEEGAKAIQRMLKLDAVFLFEPSVYHINMGLSILAGRATVICLDAFEDHADAEAIMSLYEHNIVISKKQMEEFAGNLLAVSESEILVSSRGYASFTDKQQQEFHEAGFKLYHADLSEIEKCGGSMRCLLGEIY